MSNLGVRNLNIEVFGFFIFWRILQRIKLPSKAGPVSGINQIIVFRIPSRIKYTCVRLACVP